MGFFLLKLSFWFQRIYSEFVSGDITLTNPLPPAPLLAILRKNKGSGVSYRTCPFPPLKTPKIFALRTKTRGQGTVIGGGRGVVSVISPDTPRHFYNFTFEEKFYKSFSNCFFKFFFKILQGMNSILDGF